MRDHKNKLEIRKISIPLCIFLLTICVNNSSADTLVARKDYNVSRKWELKKVMGRNFWNVLENTHLKRYWPSKLKNINQLPMVKDAALRYRLKSFTKSKESYIPTVSVFDALNLPEDVPFFIHASDARPVYRCLQYIKCNENAYKNWKKKHANFAGFLAGREWDNEFNIGILKGGYARYLKMYLGKSNKSLPQLIATIKKELPKPESRDHAIELLHKCFKAAKKYNFNESEKLSFMREVTGMEHQVFEWGADTAWIETTNSGPYRYQIGVAFARGASRQYNRKWGWYIANFYNGYNDKGKYTINNGPYYTCKPTKVIQGRKGHGYGMSTSLNMRTMYLAYLNGATFVEAEMWPYGFCQYQNKNSQYKLSPHGEIMKEWYDFTQANPARGTSYTPVAFLIPFNQGYKLWGVNSWSFFEYDRADTMIDAFMFTAVPLSPTTKNGDEGCLSNSKYGDIFDVLMPNPTSGPISNKVLDNYKVVVVLGKYSPNKILSQKYMEYVKDGGTLLINVKQLNEFFPTSFTGIIRTGRNGIVKNAIKSQINGKNFSVSDEYEFEKVTLAKAVPVLKDASENILATSNNYGKGKVVVINVDYMIPKKEDWRGKGVDAVLKKRLNCNFPFVSFFLDEIVKEVLPIEIKGDIEYGLNKINDGWWLYLINNKGVTKFTNKPQTLDVSKSVKIKVFLKNIKANKIIELREQKLITLNKNNYFTVQVEPGNVKVIEIKTN